MNNVQIAKLNMCRNVEMLCDNNPAIVSTIPAFATVFALLKDKIASLKNSAKKGSKVITGVTSEKNEEKDALSEAAAAVAGLIYTYAAANQLTELKAEADIAPSTFRIMPDNETVLACESIIALARQYMPAMTGYSLTAVKIDALEIMCETFSNAVPQPRNAISIRKKNNNNVAATIKEISLLLEEQMDKLVFSLKNDYPDFAAEYTSCRRMINTAIRHKKILPQAAATVAIPETPVKDITETEQPITPPADADELPGLIAV